MVSRSADLIGLCDDDAPVNDFSCENAWAGAIIFINERDVPYTGFELLDPSVVLWIVFQMGHDELAAAFFGGDVHENGLDLIDGVGQDGVFLKALRRLAAKLDLYGVQIFGEFCAGLSLW